MSVSPASPWLRSPAFDSTFFLGSAVISGLVGALVVQVPSLLIPALWLWMLLIEGPHLVATWQRTHFDPEWTDTSTSRLALLAAVAPLALFSAGVAGLPGAMDLLLAGAAIWSLHHTVRQHHGIVALYDARARPPRWIREIDRWGLQIGLWSTILAGQFLLPLNRRVIGAPESLIPLGWVFLAVASLCVIALVGRIGWAVRNGVSPLPGIVALGPAVGFVAFLTFGMGSVEPVYAAATTPEQLVLAVSLVGGLMHGLQYMGLIAIANPPRLSKRAGLAGRFGRNVLAAYGVGVALSFGYLLINAARSAHPGWMLFDPQSHTAHFFVAVYWGLFFHHYVLDARIWKVSRDPGLRAELALG